MTDEDIIRMAEEACLLGVLAQHHNEFMKGEFDLSRYPEIFCFARLVYEATFRDANIAASKTILDAAVLEEREACAKVCDDKVDAEYATGKVDHNEMGWTQACASTIRARSKE